MAAWGVFVFPVVVAAALAVIRWPLHALGLVVLAAVGWAVCAVLEWVLRWFIK